MNMPGTARKVRPQPSSLLSAIAANRLYARATMLQGFRLCFPASTCQAPMPRAPAADSAPGKSLAPWMQGVSGLRSAQSKPNAKQVKVREAHTGMAHRALKSLALPNGGAGARFTVAKDGTKKRTRSFTC